jgi:hypothetical protein
MPKPTLSSAPEYALKVESSMSTTSPASSAGTSSSEPVSPLSFIEVALTDLGIVLSQKNSDYKIDGEFSNFEYAAEISGSDTLGVIMTQIGIKLGRLKGLPEEVYNESKLDTFKDLAGYAVILYAYALKMEADSWQT